MDVVTQVLRAIEDRPVNPSEFVRCACALLRTRFPGLSAVEGGHDFGRDADIYFPFDEDDPNSRGRLCATVGDPVDNLRTGLRRMAEEGLRVDLVVVACLQPVNARARRRLGDLCTQYRLPAPHVYAREWFVAELVSEPDWRHRLLGVGGRVGALLDQPLDALEVDTPPAPLVGRIAEQAAVRAAVRDRVDVVVVGVPGVGKTRLSAELGEDVLFLQLSDPGQVLDDVVAARPAAIVVDDAHTRTDELHVLRRIRIQERAPFSIIATTWPDVSDQVAAALPGARTVQVPLLERAEMDALVRSIGVTGHRARTVVLTQAEGRPGWAMALCEVLIAGGGQQVLTGAAHLDQVDRYLRRITDSPTAMDALACLAALNILSTESAYRLAPLVGLPPAELTGLLDRLARHGLLDRTTLGWSLQPALRAPLVAQWFFREPASRPWRTLVEAFPDQGRTLLLAAIGAARTGSRLARHVVDNVIDSIPPPSPDEEIDAKLLGEYATLDEQAARHAVTRACATLDLPHRPTSIGRHQLDLPAHAATTVLIGATRQWLLPDAVTALLDLAIGDTRPRNSNTDHPLRVLGDLARVIDPDHGTSIEIRERLLAHTLNWLTANPTPDRWFVATEMLANLFSPEVSGTWSDPGNPDTFTFSRGYDSSTNLQRLVELWDQIDQLFAHHPTAVTTTCSPEALCPLIDLVTDWFHLATGQRHGGTDDTKKEIGKAGARRILETLRPIVQTEPGLAARAQRVLDHRPFADRDDEPPAAFALDPDLVDLLGGTREPEGDIHIWLEGGRRRLGQLAERLAGLGPENGSARFTELIQAARLAGNTADGKASTLALQMGPHMTAPAVWLRVASRDRIPALLHTALHEVLVTAPASVPVEELLVHLDDPTLRTAIVSAALIGPEIDEFTDRVLAALDSNDVPLIAHYVRLDTPTELHHRLLTHPHAAVAAAAALAIADARSHGFTIPSDWTDAWRTAIRDMPVEDLDQHSEWNAERLLKYLATHDPDLFEDWFTHQLDQQATARFLRPPDPHGCEQHLAVLPRPHRERLARKYAELLHLPRFDLTLLTHLTGNDPDLAAQLLNENVITTEHLLDAITGQRGTVLEHLAPILLNHGTDPAHIASCAGLPLGVHFGTDAARHQEALTFFRELAHRVPTLRAVAEAGQTQQAELLARAEKQQRQERVHGN